MRASAADSGPILVTPKLVSVLLVFGGEPGRAERDNRSVLHHAAAGGGENARVQLRLLRHFLGGLDAAGKAGDFDGWNAAGDGGANPPRPLDLLNDSAGAPTADKLEIQALLYERGARCAAPAGKSYCGIPDEVVRVPINAPKKSGEVLTVTSRDFGGASFELLLPDAEVMATLSARGWRVDSFYGPPRRAVLSRMDSAAPLPEFPVEMLRGGETVRRFRVSPTLPTRVETAWIPSDGAGGTLRAAGLTDGSVNRGDVARLTATPAAGWYVESWNYSDCVNTGAAATPGVEQECVLTANADLQVTVVFAVARTVVYGEDVSASLAAAGGATVASGDTVADGVTIAFLATPPENHQVAEWTNNGAAVCAARPACVLTVKADVNVRAAFELVGRTIAYSEIPAEKIGGTLTALVPSGGTTLHGTTVTFTATPAAGWYVEGWNDGACVNTGAAAIPGVEQECALTANANLLVTATFAVARAVVYGEDVSASLAAGGATVASGDTVADGVTIAFLATPPENHELAGWTNNGATVCVGENPCLLGADADLNARAKFASLLRTIIYAEVPDDQIGGTLTALVPSDGTTLRGTTVTFTATPAAGWYVEGWNNGACVNTGAAATPEVEQECALTADANLLVTVTFAVARAVFYGEDVSASLAAGGATVASGDTVADGVTIAFLATPPENHRVAGWTNNGAAVCAARPACVLTVKADVNVRAAFELVGRTIAYSEIPAEKIGGTLTALVPSGGTTLHGTTVTFTATPAAGWYVEGWNDGACVNTGAAAIPGVEQECALTANANLLVTATFAVARAVVYGEDVSASLAAGGATVASGDTVADGVTIAFLATPPENYELAGWTNNGATVCVGENPCLLGADADLNAQAKFASLLRTIIYAEVPDDQIGGTLTALVPSDGTTLRGTTVTFTATPAAGWYVEGWNNGACVNTGAAATPGVEQECALTADANLLVTATFAVAREVVFGEGLFASLTADGASVASGDTVADGVTIAFLATPPENHELAGWTNNGAEVCVGQNPCVLEADGDLDVRAEFASLLRTIVYAALPGDGSGGTLTASVPSGGTTLRGTTVTFTATPAAGWTLAAWEGDGADCAAEELECGLSVNRDLFVTVHFAENCGAKNRAPGGLGSGFAPGSCGGCLDGHGLFGLTRDLCADAKTGDFGDIPQKDVCLKLQGGAGAQLEGDGRVCSGVDANDTFCILDSADALPCRGLFRHVLKCNVGWNRPALNPFFCGEACEGGEKAVGGECLLPPAPIEE